jgi:S-adenosylmethionine-diacylgycerolhomoserine-N-methlytransferase
MTLNPRSALLPSATPRPSGIEGYYRLHARIYDATRWSFLFGRDAIIARAAALQPRPKRILEIGCGTGRNLAKLARRYPDAQLTGVDLSDSMLAIARRKTAVFGSRVTLLPRAYGPALATTGGYDLVLCSYALTMFNPGYDQALAAACSDLSATGCLALVDFAGLPAGWGSTTCVWMDSSNPC